MDDVDDVLKTVNFFREMKAINKEFFCDMQLDESDSVKNIFWANASCRGAYQDFGDCVTFDTTYKTNKYHMPLGVFVGTNNHLQTTFFVFALIRDEDADSFRWLFRTFLRCMRGKAPTCILTGTICHLKKYHPILLLLISPKSLTDFSHLQTSARQWLWRWMFYQTHYTSYAAGTS